MARISAELRSPVVLELDEYLPYLVNRLGARIAGGFSRALAQHGLSVPMWRVLAVLWQEDEQRQIDLALLTSIDASTLSRLIKTIQDLGLVSRTRSTVSQREVTIRLTARGRAVTKALVPVALDYEAVATRGFSPQELALLKRLLRRAYDNMAAADSTD